MIQRVLSHYQMPGLACVGLILFMMVFIAALVWVFRKGSTDFYSTLVELPFKDIEKPSKGES